MTTTNPQRRSARRDGPVNPFSDIASVFGRWLVAPTAVLSFALLSGGCPTVPYHPNIVASEFVATVNNPFFPLKPGTQLVYEETSPGSSEHIEVTVLSETRTILGVVCTVVHDVGSHNGQVVEDTYDWYAQHRDGTVWYFGEDTKTYENGVPAGTTGSWEAGVNGAQPGIIMEAGPQVGDSYRQEYLRDAAEDEAAVAALGETVTVTYGTLSGCVKTRETTRLEPGLIAYKYYTSGIGEVLTVEGDTRAELVSATLP